MVTLSLKFLHLTLKIYRLPCEYHAMCVDETGRSLEVRVDEHKKMWKRAGIILEIGWAPTNCIWNKQNNILWSELEILGRETGVKLNKQLPIWHPMLLGGRTVSKFLFFLPSARVVLENTLWVGLYWRIGGRNVA